MKSLVSAASLTAARAVPLIGKLLLFRAPSLRSMGSNALTCKELLRVADSERSGALFIDPGGG